MPESSRQWTSCFCPIGAVERDIVLKPDLIPLPAPDVPDWRSAADRVEQANRERHAEWERRRAAENARVEAVERQHREMRDRCGLHGTSAGRAV